ncbi:alpha/beta hydrolase family protein [Streptomyces triticiradicis]|uniref:Alpha/beta hydrolase n=1 Tax=Streptomyces triticiradicis TaxID=2651189 RepID=A0A7J5D3N4_9ACTN|nr:hypothetical protein [Streptomyces triticiradicis]KAB1976924.1 hypothetical protein F8144_43250 [Streptomyces triticiradicis]
MAVVRFGKVTCAHGGEVAKVRDLTVANEYVPHALAAVDPLRQHPAVYAERVFMPGHSLGGTLTPRVAAREPSVAGLGPFLRIGRGSHRRPARKNASRSRVSWCAGAPRLAHVSRTIRPLRDHATLTCDFTRGHGERIIALRQQRAGFGGQGSIGR